MTQEEIGQSLLAAFARVPDPRSRHGRRHPLPAVLALATAAMLAGARSLYAIAQWGRLQPPEVVRALGFTRTRTPSLAMLHYTFKALDATAFEAALQQWVIPIVDQRRPAGQPVAIDGKALRGIHGEEVPGVRLVALYDGEAGLGDRRKRGVKTKQETEEGKQEAELGVAPALLRRVPWRGRLVTGDALSCQRALCQQIRRARGDYLFAIKANQPELLTEVTLLFTDPPPDLVFQTAQQTQLHGDRVEVRTLRASAALNAYLAGLGWRGVGLVLEAERVVRWPAKPDQAPIREVRYFLTSLPATSRPERVLEGVRGHWRIENRLHDVRDVTLGEDACRVRSGAAPPVLAALRNCVLGVLRQRGCTNIAARLRYHAWQPASIVLRLLGIVVTG